MITMSLERRFTQFLIASTVLAILATAFTAAVSVNWHVRHQQSSALADYMSERGLREDAFFNSVADSQNAAMQTFNEYVEGLTDAEIQTGLDTYFPLQENGARRGTDELFEGVFIPGYGRVYGIAALGSSTHEWTPARERTFYSAFLTIARHGVGMNDTHESLWFMSPLDDLIIFAPNRPDRLEYYRHEAPHDFSATSIGIGDVSEPDVNPEGRTRCTPLMSAAYDQTGETLVTGCQTPLRQFGGGQVGIFGTTMFVNEVFQAAFDALPNMDSDIYFISAEGQLIAHHDIDETIDVRPALMREMEERIDPEELLETFQNTSSGSDVFFRNPEHFASEAIAFYHLEIPDWYLVISIPEQTLLYASLNQLVPIFIMSLTVGACVIIGMTIFVRRVALKPLGILTRSLHAPAGATGDMDHQIDGLTERRDEIGQLASTLADFRNRTEAYTSKLEDTVAQRTEKLRRLSEAKSTFLATMSHELRTPMNGILGVSGALNRTNLTTEQSEMVELIQQSTQMLERQLSDVLDVSKVEAGKLELIRNPTNLASCVTELCDFHRHTARERGLDLNLNFDVSAHGYFLADEVRIRQVLNNIITNAIKFTSEGSVTIDVSGGEYLDVTRQVVSFKVTDTGVGMNAESLAQIFEPYAQPTKNVAEPNRGTGLGLTISKSLVELMKGEIMARSRPGHGSVFAFEIPLVRCQTQNPSLTPVSEEAEALADHLSSTRVLLAEDHPVNQRVVQLILKPLGVDVEIVENGQDAVEAYKNGSYDVILMDMRMPVMDGLVATRQIRDIESNENRGHTPILVLSANAMPEHCDQSMMAGADMHVGKPLTPERLIDAVREGLELKAEGSGAGEKSSSQRA